MTDIAEQAQQFLYQLHTMTEGEEEAQVSMYDVGAALGLDKQEAGALAEDLIVDGMIELKTLAGGIGLTQEGLQKLEIGSGSAEPAVTPLGFEPVLSAEKQAAVHHILGEIQGYRWSDQLSLHDAADLIIDLKTIEVQLLSSQPKTAIVREILNGLAQELTKLKQNACADRIKAMVGQ